MLLPGDDPVADPDEGGRARERRGGTPPGGSIPASIPVTATEGSVTVTRPMDEPVPSTTVTGVADRPAGPVPCSGRVVVSVALLPPG